MEASRQALASLLSVTPDNIQVVSLLPATWADACLGVDTSGLSCAQVLVPGYRILFTVNGLSYEYHTNQDGSQVALANILPIPVSQPNLQVTIDPDQPDCQYIQVSATGIAQGGCSAALSGSAFSDSGRAQELSDLVGRFASFSADTPSGEVTFTGKGSEAATSDQQRALAAWARLVAVAAASQSTPDSPPGLVISWQRSGGIVGRCSQLQIFDSGWAYLSACNQDENGLVNRFLLSSQELQFMYNWVDTYAAIDYSTNDGVADGYQYDLSFRGGGTQQVPDLSRDELNQFAQSIFAEFSP